MHSAQPVRRRDRPYRQAAQLLLIVKHRQREQDKILEHIAQQPGWVTWSDLWPQLCSQLELTPVALRQLINQLVRHGRLIRHSQDGKTQFIHPNNQPDPAEA